jgi:hypothetical protein
MLLSPQAIEIVLSQGEQTQKKMATRKQHKVASSARDRGPSCRNRSATAVSAASTRSTGKRKSRQVNNHQQSGNRTKVTGSPIPSHRTKVKSTRLPESGKFLRNPASSKFGGEPSNVAKPPIEAE